MTDYRAIFEAIVADARYQEHLDWGQPRSGHPEGTIRAHIAELEGNLQRLKSSLSEADFWKLKVLVHTHDTFKGDAKQGVPIQHPRSHASLARAFLAEFCNDADLLEMVQYHDEPFALYQHFTHKGVFPAERWAALLQTIQEWNLFLAFNIIDGCTVGKGREPLYWLFAQVASRVETRWTVADIL